MHDEESIRKQRRLGRVALWLGAGLLAVAVFQSISLTRTDPTAPADQAANRPDLRTIRVKTVDLDPVDVNPPEAERADFELTAGETTSVVAQDLPTGRPLALNLLLPAGLPSAAGLPARIIAMDGSRELKLTDAVVANDRDQVRVQIESAWLTPGRYRIEIETTERSHLALRRYLLEVR
jgi:hypothetical protein